MSLRAPFQRFLQGRWPAIILFVGLGFYAANVVRHHARLWDDAFITFRFATHLADGQGLVWNLNGERVEGYTSFLHVLLLAGAARTGVALEFFALAVSIAATLGSAAIMVLVLRREAGALTVATVLPVALYLAAEPTAIHSTSGLETPLFLLALAGGVAVGLRFLEAPRLSTAVALAVVTWVSILCRPEGALFGGAVYVVLLASLAARTNFGDGRLARGMFRRTPLPARDSVRLVVLSGILVASLTGLYAAWKYAYFGYLLPNPYYVKSHRVSLEGFFEVRDFVEHVGWRLGPLVAAVLLTGLAARKRFTAPPDASVKIALLLLPAVFGLGYYVTIIHEVGGAHRFSYPTLVYLTLTAGYLCAIASSRDGNQSRSAGAWRVSDLAPAFVGVLCLVALQPSYDIRPLPRGEFNDYHWKIATALRDTGLGPSAMVLTDAAGVIPYVSGFNQLDRVGLTDNHLSGRQPLDLRARERYIWSRGADVYIGYEPPASSGVDTSEADPRMRTPYVSEILLRRRLYTIEDRIFVQDPVLLYERMQELRDNWEWIGEIDWPGWRIWNLKSFLYVRKNADERLRTHLQAIVSRIPGEVMFEDVKARHGVAPAN